MKKILGLALLLTLLLSTGAKAQVTMNGMLADVKAILAEGEPRFSDQEIVDYMILSIQSVATHGFACHLVEQDIATPSSHSLSGDSYDALFVRYMNNDRNTANHHAIWEITPSDLGRKEFSAIAPVQYFYQYLNKDQITYEIYGRKASIDTLEYLYYFVPFAFEVSGSDTIVPVSEKFRDIIIDHTLFLCYVSIEDWPSAWDSLNKYLAEIGVAREVEYNELPDWSFGTKSIQE